MEIKLPSYLKITIILLGLILAIWLLQAFKSILVPVAFSGLFALLLMPMSERLESYKIPRVLAILICLIVIIVALSGVIWFLSAQLMSFSKELPNITDNLSQLVTRVQNLLYQKFGIEPTNKRELIQNTLGNLRESGTAFVGSTISMTTGALTAAMLVPIFTFCFLYYRDHFRQFMFMFVTKDKRGSLMHTVDNIQKVVQSYISGLMIVILIVALLNSIGLFIMDVKYAIFFGTFAAILTIIPYIGILIGAFLPALFVLVERGSVLDAVIVVGIFTFVQFLEGNFITPYITGSKVSINPLAAILALLIGGQIWGAAGMILAIPAIAVLKILFDAYEPLRPVGFLLCDISEHRQEPGFVSKIQEKISRIFNVKKQP